MDATVWTSESETEWHDAETDLKKLVYDIYVKRDKCQYIAAVCATTCVWTGLKHLQIKLLSEWWFWKHNDKMLDGSGEKKLWQTHAWLNLDHYLHSGR